MGECVNWDGGFDGRLCGLMGEMNMKGILILVGNR